MPKVKTKRAAAKRFRKSATGKIKRKKAFKSHIQTKMSHKRVRQLRKAGFCSITSLWPTMTLDNSASIRARPAARRSTVSRSARCDGDSAPSGAVSTSVFISAS